MAAYVIKKWSASDQPDASGTYVTIVGRREGIVSWYLAAFGIDPTVSITIDEKRIEFSQASLSGSIRRVIPLLGVCSTLYGYQKPWKKAVSILVLVTWVFSSVGSALNPKLDGIAFSMGWFVFGIMSGALVAVVYYFLNRTLTIAFAEHSGIISEIKFKRSIIENQDINETQAGYVCRIVQALIEARQEELARL